MTEHVRNLEQSNARGEPEIFTGRMDRMVHFAKRWSVDWARRSSLWPLPFATACCGIELMAVAASRYDLSRFGAEVLRFSPRQADLLIVAGRVAIKILPVLQRVYLQMCEPKWVISMGACASSGGVFDAYATIQGIDQFIPVDVYIPGCPPRPEAIIEGVMSIQRLIDTGQATNIKRPLGVTVETIKGELVVSPVGRKNLMSENYGRGT
jgi:NADH-quinone oxidoreductase subunit B